MAVQFPPVGMSEKEDAARYGVELTDSTIKSDTEGGYEYTRPRFTRAPSRIFSTGFSEIDADDFALLEAFWQEHQSFRDLQWTNPVTGEVIFGRLSEPPNVTYTGLHKTQLYSVTFKIKEI